MTQAAWPCFHSRTNALSEKLAPFDSYNYLSVTVQLRLPASSVRLTTSAIPQEDRHQSRQRTNERRAFYAQRPTKAPRTVVAIDLPDDAEKQFTTVESVYNYMRQQLR
jgi:hypothetical protein